MVVIAVFTLFYGTVFLVNNTAPMTYDSIKLERFSDGVKYDAETHTIYTSGKVAKWAVKRAENAFLQSGDKEFWMDNNKQGKYYKCVLVENIVYGN